MQSTEIWVVDDNALFQNLAAKIIRFVDPQADVISYFDGNEALDAINIYLKQGMPLPKLVFLDLNMPFMNGWELLDALCLIPSESIKKMPIYTLSSSFLSDDRDRALTYPWLAGCLTKPLTTTMVTSATAAL